MHDLIVPELLEEDCSLRKKKETCFEFPFNNDKYTVQEAYNDIASKLGKLSFPNLFLNNVESIEFEIDDKFGIYEKYTLEHYEYATKNTTVELLSVNILNNNKDEKYKMWKFTRTENKFSYSICIGVDDNNKLIPYKYTAFCFFPTKVTTKLNFMIHAPFLLTDSREGIKAGNQHNKNMVEGLANLAADSISYLIDIESKSGIRYVDEKLFDIIPMDIDEFDDEDDIDNISFMPIYRVIKENMKSSQIIPVKDGYAYGGYTYWAAVNSLKDIISDDQLMEMKDSTKVRWLLYPFGRDETLRKNYHIYEYISNIIKGTIDENGILDNITERFIEVQKIDWLFKFYGWIIDSQKRVGKYKCKPIFLDNYGNASSAYDKDGHMCLFIPDDNITGYTVVKKELYENNNTKKLLELLHIKKPTYKDHIFSNILPRYKDYDSDAWYYFVDNDLYNLNGEGYHNEGEEEYKKENIINQALKDFKIIFEYYLNCSLEERYELIKEIKMYNFFISFYCNRSKWRLKSSNCLYIPSEKLVKYYSGVNDIYFLYIDEYRKIINSNEHNMLEEFFTSISVKSFPSIYQLEPNKYISILPLLPMPHSSREIRYIMDVMDGCIDCIRIIVDNGDVDKSIVLWEILIDVLKREKKIRLSEGRCIYFYRTIKILHFENINYKMLKNEPWILSKDGVFVNAGNISVEDLSDQYDTSSEYAKELIDFLQIMSKSEELKKAEDEENKKIEELSPETQDKIAWGDLCHELGVTDKDELREAIRLLKEQKANRNDRERIWEYRESDNSQHQKQNTALDNIDDEDKGIDLLDDENKEIAKTKSKVVKDIINKSTYGKSNKGEQKLTEEISLENDYSYDDIEDDFDDYTPKVVDYKQKIEKAKDSSAREIDQIIRQESLQEEIKKADRYSFKWFKSLLKMECLNCNESSLTSKEISIIFAKIEKEEGTNRTYVLKNPNRYIPQFVEELSDIPLQLYTGDKKLAKNPVIEVANVKSYTLRIKLRSDDEIGNIDLCKITSAKIDAKSPAFLLEELYEKFISMELDDDFNLRDNLCENIEFIFGPPGTGKTTYLANDVLIPLIKQERKVKVLVLTPTNKAADVLTRRIIDVMGNDTSYMEWLIRFGATSDEFIEDCGVFKNKTFNIKELSKNVTVTTIARFPYDFFMPQGSRLFLDELKWDYIVIDEASMISLASIIYPLYKKEPKKFIIAGDPFQIAPITAVDIWKDENIYTLVNLKSFEKPATIPHNYPVKLLNTQYRSVPEIGNIFSRLTYDGILKHYRNNDIENYLQKNEDMDFVALNLIKFPVSKYESIYRAKRLQNSPYHIYSALLTFEFTRYLSRMINPAYNRTIRIGVIAPYRAQADLINRLILSINLPQNVDIQVGTVHGFQGDECEIIIALFNPPPRISDSSSMFLNKKNIINVSISRARDYLFVVMPDKDTENVENLKIIRKVENIIKRDNDYREYLSHGVEEVIWGNENYLEDNTFSTSHQSVNVYREPEKHYEVRSEDNAVDIQLYEIKKIE